MFTAWPTRRKQAFKPALCVPGTLNMPMETPFEDLEVRSLLSRSNTYGRLYSASWRGAPVAVKVCTGACPGALHGSACWTVEFVKLKTIL